MTNNSEAYLGMVAKSKDLGADFRSAVKRQREIAVLLVTAAVIDNYQLEPLVEDSKKAAGFAKLQKPDQRRLLTFYSNLRTIVGGWSELSDDERKAFLAGERVYSTVASDIVAARKKADEAEQEPEPTPNPVEGQTITEPDEKPMLFSEAPMTRHLSAVHAWLDELDVKAELDGDTAQQLAQLLDAVEDYRSRVADAAKKKAA